VQIAYVTETYPPELNGVALTVARCVDYLRTRGHELELIRPRQGMERAGDDAGEWLTPGWPIPMYPDLRIGLPVWRRLAARWRRRRPQLVHIATEGPLGWAAGRAARALEIPLTSDYRTHFHQYSRYYGYGWAAPLLEAYLRRFHNGTDRTFVPTAAVLRELDRAGYRKLELVGRGVDAQLFQPARRSAALRAGWQAGPDTPVLLYVGRLAAEKNVATLFSTFAQVRAQRPDARLVLVGDGPLSRQLRQDHPEACFAGIKRGEDLAEHYASADLFLFPSLTDTFGNVVLEAMASGLAVLAFDSAAAAVHIEHGVSGWLAAPGDEAAFIAGACSLLRHDQRLPALRAAARAVALRSGWDGALGRFEACLASVVDEAAHA
jgi:glycosyltransferase involved in cell wall biosynthesis